MNIILESVFDKPGVCPIYDEPGVCPKCGQPMRALRLYSADTQSTSMGSTSTYRAGRWEKTTRVTTHYFNIQPRVLGFCEVCHHEEQDKRQTERGQNPASPVWWVVGAVLAAIGLAIIIRSMILNEHDVGALLSFGFAAFAIGLVLFFRRIGKYNRERKEYLRCRSGKRDFFEISESTVAVVLSQRQAGKAWLTEQQLKEIQAQNDPLGLGF